MTEGFGDGIQSRLQEPARRNYGAEEAGFELASVCGELI